MDLTMMWKKNIKLIRITPFSYIVSQHYITIIISLIEFVIFINISNCEYNYIDRIGKHNFPLYRTLYTWWGEARQHIRTALRSIQYMFRLCFCGFHTTHQQQRRIWIMNLLCCLTVLAAYSNCHHEIFQSMVIIYYTQKKRVWYMHYVYRYNNSMQRYILRGELILNERTMHIQNWPFMLEDNLS